jgi:hypothetical protein
MLKAFVSRDFDVIVAYVTQAAIEAKCDNPHCYDRRC